MSQGGPAPAPQTLGSFANQVLTALVPNEESILRLAGMATGGPQTNRVPADPDATGGDLALF